MEIKKGDSLSINATPQDRLGWTTDKVCNREARCGSGLGVHVAQWCCGQLNAYFAQRI